MPTSSRGLAFENIEHDLSPGKRQVPLYSTNPCNGRHSCCLNTPKCDVPGISEPGPSSCLSASVNRSQQARSQLSLLFIYAEGTLRMQPLHPVLLNSSAAASAVEPQSLVSCWGVQDTIRHFRFCAGFPGVITAVEFWDFDKHTERDTQPQLSLTPCSQGIGLF